MKLEVLSRDDVEKIHRATLRVLERTGVKVHSEKARKLLGEAGCRVKDDAVVKIPPHLVEDALRTAAKGFLLYDRLGRPALKVSDRNSYFGTGITNPSFRDYREGSIHPTTRKDIADAALISDYLPHIDWISPLGSVQDVPSRVSDVHEFENAVSSTVKPIVFIANDVQGLADILEMAETVAGGREALEEKPFVISYPEPTSPLVHTEEALDKLLYSAERGIPIIYTPCAMCGATAPVTPAGNLVQTNAECLSGLVMVQLQRKGNPFVMGGVLTIMDMATTMVVYGAPEMSLILAGCADVARYYGLPTWGTAGCSDSKIPDEQAAIEATFSGLMNALAGLNLIHDPGFLEGAMIGSLEMLMITNEVAGMAKRVLKGISVDEKSLAEEVIHQAGPGGHYLDSDHTVKHFRDEIWFPTLMDRRNFQAWRADGEKSMGIRIKEKIDEVLETYRPVPLADNVRTKVQEIRTRSEKERGT